MSAELAWQTGRSLPSPTAAVRAVVVVPARDEALLLPKALAALAAQQDVPPHSFEVLVLANNCSDDTAALARAFARDCEHCAIHVAEVELPAERANVGVVRRMLMDEAARRLEQGEGSAAHPGVILSTDGDTRVEPDWVAASLAAIAQGADAVGGRILTEPDVSWQPRIGRVQRLDSACLLLRSRLESLVDPDPADPWPRHHQHFGASLAVTVAAYRRVGGLPAVPYLEDEALIAALRLHDARVRHAPQVRVRTSGRLQGRVEVGLSWQLGQWAAQLAREEEHQVADPTVESEGWRARREVRQLWKDWRSGHRDVTRIKALAGRLALDPPWLLERLDAELFFGRLWQAIEQRRAESLGPVPRVALQDAVESLRRQIAAVRAAAPVGKPRGAAQPAGVQCSEAEPSPRA